MTLTAGKRSGLSAISTEDGLFCVLSVDQRNSLRSMLRGAGRPSEDADLSAFKVAAVRALAPAASGVLLDPDYGVGPVQEAGALPEGVGLLVAAEPPTPPKLGDEPRAALEPGRDAAFVRGLGGDAVKFLIRMRPDRVAAPGEPDLAAEAVAVVRALVEDCRAADVACVVETLLYPLPGEDGPPSGRHRADLVVESARVLAEAGPDLLKLEYPTDADGCRRVSEAAGDTPWAVLSAGVDYDTFLDVLRVSTDAGAASGFIAGRAIWKESVALAPAERDAFLADTGRRRFETCRETIAGRGRPWTAA